MARSNAPTSNLVDRVNVKLSTCLKFLIPSRQAETRCRTKADLMEGTRKREVRAWAEGRKHYVTVVSMKDNKSR